MLAKLAKPALPIKLLCEELPKADLFSAHKILGPFPNKTSLFQDSGYALGPCALFIADTNPREPCVSCSSRVVNTFLISSYFQAKWQKRLLCGAISHNDTVFL